MAASPQRSSDNPEASRRDFLQAAGAVAAAASVGPMILHASDKAGSKTPVLGTGAFQYEVVSHNWGELPDHVQWGETHGVAVDESGLVYIAHRSNAPQPVDAIVVFDPNGKYVRSFGKEYHTGGHGVDIRKEGNEEFLYLCSTRTGLVTKTTLKGEIVWKKERLLETGKYDDPKTPYSPTNIAFAPDGGFYIGDGYGSHWIHQYDKDAKWIRTFGGFGADFYAAYARAWPLPAGHARRCTLYNLYHVLNHFNLFGGGYGRQAAAMMAELLGHA